MSSSRKRFQDDAARELSPKKVKKEELDQEIRMEDKKEIAKPFSDCTVTLAVDVSGSTAGRVLAVEKGAISTISSELAEPAKKAALIVPWSHRVYPTITLGGIRALEAKAGTQPSNLCYSQNSVTALQKSSLWFLMTDGQVYEHEIHKFANAVPDIQLHGTACVIIIFGRRPAMPKIINVSVGYSVFAVAPHCLLLFHDIMTEEVFALRAKGCFESLLPDNIVEDQGIPIADQDTKWADVTRITYHDLAGLRIPNPIPLSTDHIVLSDGSRVNITNVLNNTIPEPVSARLFDNERDLTSVLTTAGSRGLGHRADAWLTSNQELAAATGDRRRQRSIQHGQRVQKASSSGGFASLAGLSRSSRGIPREPPTGSLSTASTVVAPDSRGSTTRTLVEEDEEE